MAKANQYERLAWEDRFNAPSTDSLRDALPLPARRLFDGLRKHLLLIESIKEGCAWYGDCWRWSIEYRLGGAPPENNLLAVLIPSPEDFQVAMRIDPSLAESLPVRQFKRALRDGLDLASEPFDTRWGVWSVQHATLADEIKSLITRKHKHLIKNRH